MDGIYYVCGRYPWLLQLSSPTHDSLWIDEANLDLRRIRSGPAFLSTPVPLRGLMDDPIDPDSTKLQAFVLMRPYRQAKDRPAGARERVERSTKLTRLLVESAEDAAWDLRQISIPRAAEWWLLAEVLAPGVEQIADLLDKLERRNVATTTKIALVRWKDRLEYEPYFSRNRKVERKFSENPELDLDLRIATITKNLRTLLLKSPEERCREIVERLQGHNLRVPKELSDRIRAQVSVQPAGPYVRRDLAVHPNPFVERVNLRPVSDDWEVKFVFLRAQRGPQDRAGRSRPASDESPTAALRRALEAEIGVRPNRIVSHFFQITGEFDFVLMVWTDDISVSTLEKSLASLPIAGRPTIIACKLPPNQATTQPVNLGVGHCATALALVRNAEASDTFFEELRQASRTQTGNAVPSARVAAVLRDSAEGGEDVALPKGLSDLGLAPNWELDRHRVQSAFLRLYARNAGQLEKLLTTVRTCTGQSGSGPMELAFDYWIAERSEVIGIARYVAPLQLERFLYRVRANCERAEFHVIFSQESNVSNLPVDAECAPCTYGKRIRKSAKGSASVTPDPAKNCATCGRYVRRPPLRHRIDLVTYQKTSKRADVMRGLTVGLVDMHLTLEQLADIGAVPRRTRGFDSWYAERGEAHPGFSPRAYADALLTLLERELAGSDVIVLPEYCVPLESWNAIVSGIADGALGKRSRERLVVFGTHIDRAGYNVAPIVHIDRWRQPHVYLQQKNRRSSNEERHGFPRKLGSGSLVLRTHFGNVLCSICADAFTTNLGVYDIDLVLLPSFHEGIRDTLLGTVDPLKLDPRIVAFANGAARSGAKPLPRANSFLSWGTQPDESAEPGAARPLFQYGDQVIEGAVLERKIDAIQVDKKRASAEHRPPDGVFPLHVDLWGAATPQVPAVNSNLLAAIKANAKAASGRDVEDHLLLDDWKDGQRAWREARKNS